MVLLANSCNICVKYCFGIEQILPETREKVHVTTPVFILKLEKASALKSYRNNIRIENYECLTCSLEWLYSVKY